MSERRGVGDEPPESDSEPEAWRAEQERSGSGLWLETGGSEVPGKILERGLGSQTIGEEKGLPSEESRGGRVGEDEAAPWSGD